LIITGRTYFMNNKTVLWIGCNVHSPLTNKDVSFYKNMTWHCNIENKYSIQSLIYDICDMFDIKTLTLRDKCIIYNNTIFDLKQYENIIFTWNLQTCSIDDIEKMIHIKNEAKTINNDVSIVNSPDSYVYIHYKDRFFHLLHNNNCSNYIPKNKLLTCFFDIFINSIRFPKIIRSNVTCGGMETFLAYNYTDMINYYRKINDKKSIIIIEYINNKKLFYYCSYRVFMCNSKIYFAYPHVSTKTWCAHTDPEGHAPDIDNYINEYNVIANKINENKEVFIKIQNLLNINHLALDCLICNDKIFFCEPELKYGVDENYKKQLNHYGLGLNFAIQMHEKYFDHLKLSDFYSA